MYGLGLAALGVGIAVWAVSVLNRIAETHDELVRLRELMGTIADRLERIRDNTDQMRSDLGTIKLEGKDYDDALHEIHMDLIGIRRRT